jgi:WD40 repeat protein
MLQLSFILRRLVVLIPCLLLVDGCSISSIPATITQGTGTPVIPPCTGVCTPYIFLGTYAVGLNPEASFMFSATTKNVADPSVTWSLKEGPTGGSITDAGLYTAPAAEGVYHAIATSKASPSLSVTAVIAVTATQLAVTGQVSTSRFYHTASLLPTGQVFIAGGMNSDYDLADPSELYDPATGEFHDAGQVGRLEHTATVLANGDVLLAGGAGTSNTADLRKADTGVIQPTGNLIDSRSVHSATLLKDGRVLLAGGQTDSGQSIQTAEIYDPATGKFTSAGNMTAPRSHPSATLLPNGKVLIVGGAAGAEFYDPATNTFLPAPGVSAGRCYATIAPLADSRVLIAGGADCSTVPLTLDTAEIYDPSTGQSTPTGKLVAAQSNNTGTLLPDGRVLLVGGNPSVITQIYDPTTGSFSFGPRPASAKVSSTATLLPDGSVLIVGGDDAEIYK